MCDGATTAGPAWPDLAARLGLPVVEAVAVGGAPDTAGTEPGPVSGLESAA